MTHPNPKNESGNVKRPHMWVVEVSHPKANAVLVSLACDPNGCHAKHDCQHHPKCGAWLLQALEYALPDSNPALIFPDVFLWRFAHDWHCSTAGCGEARTASCLAIKKDRVMGVKQKA